LKIAESFESSADGLPRHGGAGGMVQGLVGRQAQLEADDAGVVVDGLAEGLG